MKYFEKAAISPAEAREIEQAHKGSETVQMRREPSTYNGMMLCTSLAAYERVGETWVRRESCVILDELTPK